MRADNQGEGGILALTALIPRGAANGRGRRDVRCSIAARHLRRRAALRRRHDHAGDHACSARSKVCRSRRRSSSRTSCRSRSSILIGLFVDPAVRHAPRRRAVRAGHGGLVRRRSRCSACVWIVRAPERARRDQPASRGRVLPRATACTASPCSAPCSSSVTGGEALYADMGHFGKRPIRLAWFALVLPALLLNYFGQGALLLIDPTPPQQPVLPAGARRGRCYPLVGARDGRRDHRVAGADLRRVLADAAGDAARLRAAPRHRAHLVARDGPDLRAAGELGADGRDDR